MQISKSISFLWGSCTDRHGARTHYVIVFNFNNKTLKFRKFQGIHDIFWSKIWQDKSFIICFTPLYLKKAPIIAIWSVLKTLTLSGNHGHTRVTHMSCDPQKWKACLACIFQGNKFWSKYIKKSSFTIFFTLKYISKSPQYFHFFCYRTVLLWQTTSLEWCLMWFIINWWTLKLQLYFQKWSGRWKQSKVFPCAFLICNAWQLGHELIIPITGCPVPDVVWVFWTVQLSSLASGSEEGNTEEWQSNVPHPWQCQADCHLEESTCYLSGHILVQVLGELDQGCIF